MKYRLWARLPVWLRRRIVRIGMPSYTLGSICVIEHEGSLLLVRLSYRQAWGLPGGLLERREGPAAAALRETAEEVGIPVELLGRPTIVVDPEAQRGDIVFRARPADGIDPDAVRSASPEIVEVRWFPLDALPPLHHEAAGALRAIGLAPHAH